METVRIIEKPGQKFIDILKNNIKKKKKPICPEENCLIGKNPKGGNCRTNEIVYEITCKQCGNVYIGESSRNGHTRSIEHMEQMLRNDESSVLMRHRREKHNGDEVEFEMSIISSYRHDPMSRQCAEANGIRNTDPEKRINNKN